MNEKSDSEPANNKGFKASDIKKLGADAKILIALMKQQPQKRIELCKNARIHPTTFSRYKRLLEGIIKETPEGFCLWNFNKPKNLWERLLAKLVDANGTIVELKIEKLRLGERDPITGWCKKIYDETIQVNGVIILKGAKELEKAASIQVPPMYLGILLTDGNIRECDKFFWRGDQYVFQEVEEILDGCDVSYRIAKLVTQYIPSKYMPNK